MNPDTTTEVARLREELDRFKLGFQGSCYACEPVGEMNHKLEAEVARLRELLNRAIEIADEFWRNQKQAVTVWHGELADELEEIKSNARLAPAPEEPTIKESLTVQPEWRELGPDEVIQEGDEYYTGKWTKITGWIGYPASNFAKVRTRRPLPKQEEMPLEKELDYLTREASRASDIHNHVLIVDCLRYLRDEIQKLKEAR